jgi:cytochrome c biogenesis protein CcdA
MHPFALIEQLWWAGIPAAVVVGILLGASPLAWPILATAVGVRAGASDKHDARPMATLLALGAGITVVYASLGLLTGQLDRIIREVLGAWAGIGYLTLAGLAAVGGLLMVAKPSATCRVLSRPPSGAPAAFLVGVPLGIVNCPACAGVITGAAVSAGALGSPAYSVAIMAALGVGHTLTLLFVSRLSLNAVGAMARSTATIQRVGGALLLLSAAFFLFQGTTLGTGTDPMMP